jgi:hypothetical protein
MLAALLLALPLAAGCGGREAGSRTAAAPPVAAAAVRFPSALDLERGVSNGFRQGLYRLAVMSQPRDDAADLGQDLPTGTVRGVRCVAAGARPTTTTPWPWRCRVRWQTAGGAARRTRYAVRVFPTGCFAAGATPRYPAARDATIASFSEHPLNALVSVRKGC